MPRITGLEFVARARRHVGEDYVLGARVPMEHLSWKGPWDCAEFASYRTARAIGRVAKVDRYYGCNAMGDAWTGFWASDSELLGTRVTVAEAASIPGAFVLRAPAPGAIGHIVISDGRGGSVEAHSAKRGVIESTLSSRRWDYGILPPGIEYQPAAPAAAPKPPRVVILRAGARGERVSAVQRALKAAGFAPGPIDGAFGRLTTAAVQVFQARRGLTVDGEVGSATARALGIQLRAA